MEPFLRKHDMFREVIVVEMSMWILVLGIPDDEGAECAVSPLEGAVGVVEVGPGLLGVEGVAEG